VNYAIGIDLGGSSVKAAVVQPEGDVIRKDHFDFDPREKMPWAEKIRHFVRHIQQEQNEPAEWIGLSAPGLAAANGLSIAYMPGRLHGLEGLNWTSYLEAERTVPVLNDGHAALLGEAWVGAARGYKNAIMLTLGTGVGGAALVDGRLLRGHIGRAGHLGHISLHPDAPRDVCGTPGSLEWAVGNCTVSDRSQKHFHSTRELVEAHLAGNPEATAIWLKGIESLARGVCSFINVLDPEAVIIGGGIARAGSTLFDPLQKLLDPIEWRPGGHKVKLIPAELGEYAGAFGAAWTALHCESVPESQPV